MEFKSKIKTIEWINNKSRMIDQRLLPKEFKIIEITDSEGMYKAIKEMIVRGAPAIGIAGAHGVALAAMEANKFCNDRQSFNKTVKQKSDYLKSSRPTAVNLMWAIDKQLEILSENGSSSQITDKLIQNAIKMENEDIEINKKIGQYGAKIVPQSAAILTHCNAGALATVGYGTALGVIRSAYAKDPTIKVFADETRPRQQGARLTTWELTEDGIDTTLITDGMCSYFMSKKMINLVITGADRIASNGDTANKIGTYTVAIAAKYHKIPFYIAAPLSTIDLTIPCGEQIPIEERNHDEVTHINGDWICSPKVNIINPGFDVTPNELISGIITEKGILYPPFNESIKKVFEQK